MNNFEYILVFNRNLLINDMIKVIFSHASVILFKRAGMCGGGGGMCVAGGHAWLGVHAWQGACVVGACMVEGACVSGRGACMVGGACMAGGRAWQER